VGAVCGKPARTVLCGGRPVMGVPTAIPTVNERRPCPPPGRVSSIYAVGGALLAHGQSLGCGRRRATSPKPCILTTLYAAWSVSGCYSAAAATPRSGPSHWCPRLGRSWTTWTGDDPASEWNNTPNNASWLM
jgi:hypothetical protein